MSTAVGVGTVDEWWAGDTEVRPLLVAMKAENLLRNIVWNISDHPRVSGHKASTRESRGYFRQTTF